MSKHSCPKNTVRNGMRIFDSNVSCWVCEVKARNRYADFMPHLPSLHAWFQDGEELSARQWELLYDHFFDELDHGTRTGDTGTIDEWLGDRPDRVKDLIDTIEFYCLEAA